MKNGCRLKEQLVYATWCGAAGKRCQKSYMSNEIVDTRHTYKAKFLKGHSSYVHVTSSKSSISLKAKNHPQAPGRCMKLWIKGNVENLLLEGMTIQQTLRYYDC